MDYDSMTLVRTNIQKWSFNGNRICSRGGMILLHVIEKVRLPLFQFYILLHV